MSYTPVNWQPGMLPLMQYPFPLWAFPEVLQKTFHNVSNKTQAPEGLIVHTIITALSLCCQAGVDASPMGGWSIRRHSTLTLLPSPESVNPVLMMK